MLCGYNLLGHVVTEIIVATTLSPSASQPGK